MEYVFRRDISNPSIEISKIIGNLCEDLLETDRNVYKKPYARRYTRKDSGGVG
jgi:hypothetical protein